MEPAAPVLVCRRRSRSAVPVPRRFYEGFTAILRRCDRRRRRPGDTLFPNQQTGKGRKKMSMKKAVNMLTCPGLSARLLSVCGRTARSAAVRPPLCAFHGGNPGPACPFVPNRRLSARSGCGRMPLWFMIGGSQGGTICRESAGRWNLR